MIITDELLKKARKYKLLSENDLSPEAFEQGVISLLDRLHDKIDLASWESAQSEYFFPARNGSWAVDLGKLKISELDHLEFHSFEFALLKKLCLKDDYSFEHSLKVMAISLRVARILDIPKDKRRVLAKAGALHDIGKASTDPETGKDYIDDYILKAYYDTSASERELAVLKRHVKFGARDLQKAYDDARIDGSQVIDVIAKHHERVDGSGYPSGIVLTDTDMLPQILAFADTIEAMTARQRTWQHTYSFDEIQRCFSESLTRKFSRPILNLILDDSKRRIIQTEVEESCRVTENVFLEL